MGLTASCLWQCVNPWLTKYEVPDGEFEDDVALDAAHGSQLPSASFDGLRPEDVVLDEEAQKEEAPAAQAVHFRMETMDSAASAKFQAAIFVSFIIVDTFAALLFAQKFSAWGDNDTFESVRNWFKAQLSLACAFFAAMLACGAYWARRVHQCRTERKTWSKRQGLFFLDALILFTLQSVAMVFVIAAQSMGIAMACPWFQASVSGLSFVRYTVLNVELAWMCFMMRGMMLYRGKAKLPDPDRQLIIDAPWRENNRANWGMALLACSMQASITGKLIYRLRDPQSAIPASECQTHDFDCAPSTGEVAFNILSTAFILCYAILYIVLVVLARRDHRKVPYYRYRVSFLYVEMHAKHGIFIVVLLLSMTVILRFVNVTSCWSFADVQFGIIPTQLAISVLVCVIVLLTAPARAGARGDQERWRYEISWTEAQRRAMIVRRMMDEDADAESSNSEGAARGLGAISAALRRLSAGGHAVHADAHAVLRAVLRIDRAPGTAAASPARALFCVETLIKMIYFAKLAYQIDRPEPLTDTGYALSLYPTLEEHELLVEESTDTRAFLAWGPGMLVVAFRGTVTRKNIVTDLEAWSTVHHPKRVSSLGLTLRVHTGFYRAWRTGGFGEKLLLRAGSLLSRWPGASQILFTGHSLGGALAVLASTEFVRQYPQYQSSVSVYTFGSPRVGNAPFAAEQAAAVPDTWAVVNAQDPVPRVPKGWYSRSGNRVVINPQGDVIIRPGTLDASVLFRSGGVASDHRLPSYSLSIFAVLRAQFDQAKRMPLGARGVLELARGLEIGETLSLKGVGLTQLMNPKSRRLPMPIEVYRRRQARLAAVPRHRSDASSAATSGAPSRRRLSEAEAAASRGAWGQSSSDRIRAMADSAEPEAEAEDDALTRDAERFAHRRSLIERTLSVELARIHHHPGSERRVSRRRVAVEGEAAVDVAADDEAATKGEDRPPPQE